jgi:hypothetical protein
MKYAVGGLAALGVAALLSAACHRLASPERAHGVQGAEAATPSSRAPASAADVVRLLEEREAETQTLTATFKLVLHRGDGTEESSRGALVVARPDRLRLQVLSFGMVTTYDYTVRGDRFRVRRPLEGVEKTGRFADGADADALGGDLRPLFLHAGKLAEARVSESGESFLVAIDEGTASRLIEVAKRDGRIARETLSAGGTVRVASEYSDYRAVDGVALPYRIRVTYPAKNVTLAIDVDRYTRNPPVADDLFDF